MAQIVGDIIERQRLSTQRAELDSGIEQIYRQAFPDAVRVVNPRAQMESRLSALKRAGSASGNAFLQILAKSGPVLRRTQGIQLTALNFRDGTLSLGVTASSLQTVDQLRERLLAGQELSVEIQSASSRDGKVNSRLLIREEVS